jgi:hypothetical protein
VSVKAHVGWALLNKHLNVLTHTGHMESPNLIASCVNELYDSLPPFGCYTGECRATHGVSAEAYAWKIAVGWGGTRPDSCHSCCLRGSCVSCCQVFTLARWLLIIISETPSKMGDGLIPVFKHSNWTSFMIHMAYEMDVDCLVVEEMVNVSKLFDYTRMLRIGCKPRMLIS